MSQLTTKQFRTKTEFMERTNVSLPDKWPIALDIGYSSVKTFSPNSISIFPSYARRIPADFQFASATPDEAIFYKDESEQTWIVGEVAQDMIKAGDTTDSESLLYGRERYENEMFLVIARCGIGLGLTDNQFGGPGNSEIFLQTGLPEMYMNDEPQLRETLAGTHKFSLRIGSGPWVSYEVTFPESHVFVMSQPKGTLFSICVDKEGKFTPEANDYLTGSAIVFDCGFGTLDLFPIESGVVSKGETYSDLGMRRVLQVTSKDIFSKYKVSIPVPSMQKYLETGMVRYIDKRKFESREYPFDNIIENASHAICEEALARLSNAVNLGDYNYLIVTGGTGEAWYHQICEKLKNFSTIKVIPGNQNDGLPFVYSNVRGYYLYRYNKLAGKK